MLFYELRDQENISFKLPLLQLNGIIVKEKEVSWCYPL